MRKKLLATLLSALACVFAFAIVAFAGCQSDEPQTGGAYYLSVLESGEWTNYKSDADIPTDKKFVKDGETYTLTVDLEEGASVKIAQVGSDKTYGGDELFSANTQLTKGTDNALSVGQSGTYELTLDASEGEITYKFTPKAAEATVVSVEIDDAEDIDLAIGGTKQLTATATLSDDTTATTGITWESADTSVATVSENGLVTAVAAGSTTVIAKHGSVESDPVIVNVSDEGTVTLSETSLRLAVNGEATLTYTATGSAVVGEWLSTDATIATVDQTGKVTALKAGTVTIRLSYTPKEGASPKFANCEVTVGVPVSNIALNNSAINVAMGSTATLTVSITPADATNQNYTVTISDGGDAYISVEKDGNALTITPVATGTATVTVTSEDGNYSAACEITVVEAGTVTANISDAFVSLNKTGVSNTKTLSVEVTGDTASAIVWSSSEEGVATVSDEGVVNAVAFGTTVITAAVTTAGGQSFNLTCTVRVAPGNFFLYGDLGTTAWPSNMDAVDSDLIFSGTNGVYTLTYENMPASKDFRIGDDDNFFTEYKGVNYEHLGSTKVNVVQGGRDGAHSVYNMQVSKAGTYTFTISITGAKPVLTVTCDAVAVTDISLAADNATLNAGESTNSATVTLTVNPSDATYTASDVEWTCASDDVTVVEASDKKSVTVTAKDDAAGGTVTVTCTVKGKTATANLTVVAKGAAVVPVSSIAFEKTSYSQNLNEAWTATVAANVNSDATNTNVTYSTDDSDISVDASTGVVTATKVGTFTVTATAAGDTTKTATATVTFYSNMFYLVGGDAGWGDVGSATTTVGTAKENYTFTGNESNTVFTLESVLTKSAQLQIMFCGTSSWDYAITGANCTVSGDASASGKNIIVGKDTGVYTITINLSDVTPVVTLKRDGDTPSFTATIGSATGTSTVVNNRYNITVSGVTISAATSSVEIAISGSANSTYTHSEALEAGNYRFDIVCDADGNVISSTATKIESAGPVVSTAYTLLISGDENSWTPTEIDGATLYYDAATGEYTFYFSQAVGSWKGFGFVISTDSTADNKVAELWKSNLSSVTYTDSESILNIQWDNMQSETARTIYGKLVFTVSGSSVTITAFTVASSSLNTNS